jgi:NADH-quinone oxidoreductase subunit L
MSDEQDMQKMGGIARFIPKTYIFMWIGSLALAGIPCFAGFYSKDAILEALYNSSHSTAYAAGIIVVLLTSFYSWRLLWLTFHGKPHANEHVMAHVHESNMMILAPLGILSLGAIFSGMIGHTLFMEQIDFSWQKSLVVLNEQKDPVPFIIHHLPLIISLLGILSAIYLYGKKQNLVDKLARQPFYRVSFNKWWIDELYEKIVTQPVFKLADNVWKKVDLRIIDRFGPNGIARLCLVFSRKDNELQTGYVYHYALAMIVGLMLLSLVLASCFF